MSTENHDEKQQEVVESSPTASEQGNGSNGGSSTSLSENVAAFICYLGTVITGIIFLFIEKENKFVRFHAMQSTAFFAGIWIVTFVVDYVPFLGGLLKALISLFSFIMWIVLMIKAYQHETLKLPIVGQIAEDFVNKNK